LDTNGNIFGGFTPLVWRRSNNWDEFKDPSRTSFLFTLENPFNVPPMKFPVKSARAIAIKHMPTRAPFFGKDLGLWYEEDSDGFTDLGIEYEYKLAVPGDRFLTGAKKLSIKEIEMFEIVD
jgi:hypothetical protein